MNTPLPADVAKLLDSALTLARETLAIGDEVPPTWYLMNREIGSAIMVVAPFRNDDEKYAAAHKIRHTATLSGCDCVVFICEGWAKPSLSTDPDFERLSRTGNIRDEPDRIDVLMINVETYDGFWGAMPEVFAKGRRRELAAVEFERGEQMGAMSSWLPPRHDTTRH